MGAKIRSRVHAPFSVPTTITVITRKSRDVGTLQHGFDQGEFGEFNVIVYDESGKSGASIA